MTPISTQELYDTKATKYSAQMSTEFTKAFLYAIERAIEMLNSTQVGLSGIGVPTDLETNINVDRAKYYGVVCDLVDLYLQDMGQWGSEDKDKLMQDAQLAIRRAHTQALTDTAPTTRLGDTGD